MLKENTSVYVPIETPDHKSLATLLAVLVHLGVLGFIIYTNHAKPLNDSPIEMSLVTPEQLAMIQSQAATHQQAQANTNMTSNSTATAKTSPNSPTNPAMANYNNELAARQAKWQRDQQDYAAQLDQQAMQEQAQFGNQIEQVKMAQQEQLKTLKNIENNPPPDVSLDTPKPQKSDTNAKRISLTADGAGKDNGQSTSQTSAGSGGAGASSDTGMSRGDYKAEVARRIMQNWQTAAGDKGKRLTAHFDISPSGEITNIVVDGSDSPLKNALYQAIQSASPLPPPPNKHLANFAQNNSTFIVP